MGDERAETYLRLVAEREFRRVIQPPPDRAKPPDRADPSGQADPRGWADYQMSTSNIAASVLWNLHRAGRILISAGALDDELVHRYTCADPHQGPNLKLMPPRMTFSLKLTIEPAAPPQFPTVVQEPFGRSTKRYSTLAVQF